MPANNTARCIGKQHKWAQLKTHMTIHIHAVALLCSNFRDELTHNVRQHKKSMVLHRWESQCLPQVHHRQYALRCVNNSSCNTYNNNHHPLSLFYADLDRFWAHCDQNLSLFSLSSCQLILSLVKKITEVSGRTREDSFLFQRCSVSAKHFNVALFT